MGRRPRMGAWIEIARSVRPARGARVAPAWGRGLKFRPASRWYTSLPVAPAWGRGLKSGRGIAVLGDLGRPRMGAWIEIRGHHRLSRDPESPPHGGVD